MSEKKPDNYDFPLLIRNSPELAKFAAPNTYGNVSIDFANPDAVKALNRALLITFYRITYWDIPKGYLCPPVPGRAQYIDKIAALLEEANGGATPHGAKIHLLDIGTGANCIYPIIGHALYGWSFTASDIDQSAIASASLIAKKNPSLGKAVRIRMQRSKRSIFSGIILPGEKYDAVLCNPPFHASASAAREETERKWKKLGRGNTPILNFGGRSNELWCDGGETSFAITMISESAHYAQQCFWFSILIAKEEHLPVIRKSLGKHKAEEIRVIDLEKGNKKSRVLAWSFLTQQQRDQWKKERWGGKN